MSQEETIVIDPVGMNIVNRIAPGTKFTGTIECDGGLLIEGAFHGELSVKGGPIVLMQGAVMSGDIRGAGDAFLFGNIASRSDGELSDLTMGGAVFMTQSVEAKSNVTARAIKLYEGAQVDGRIKTTPRQ